MNVTFGPPKSSARSSISSETRFRHVGYSVLPALETCPGGGGEIPKSGSKKKSSTRRSIGSRLLSAGAASSCSPVSSIGKFSPGAVRG
ncbi:MAG: hypothetical protein ABIQ16_17200 [Polyangiaceae bacterium]